MSEFEEFLSFFPEIELPVNISSEYLRVFSSLNKPVPQLLLDKFIPEENIAFPKDPELEAEYISCFRLPENQNFKAVVYLKISLLNYDFYLLTIDNRGQTISKQIISSLRSDGKLIKEKASFIDENLRIWIMEGASDENKYFDPENSKFASFIVNEKGEILKTIE